MRREFLYVAAAFVAIDGNSAFATNLPSYDVTTLPFTSASIAINNSGLVVGGLLDPDGSVSLGEWSNGTLTNLGGPSGIPAAFNIVQPFGVNDAGEIVGTIHTAAGGLPASAFVYSSGGFSVLPLANSTDLGGVATAVNNAGDVVGYDKNSSNNAQAWLWSKGVYSTLPISGIDTTALGINSSGTIVGNRTINCCSGESGYVLQGTAQYLTGAVNAINNAGEAVGVSSSVGPSQTATVFKNGKATSILSMPSSGSGINSPGDVVGEYQPVGFSGPRVFLWEPNLGAVDLTPNGYLFAVALAINSSGDIVGYGETSAGVYQDFLLTPDPHGALTATALITGVSAPEPSSGLLFGLGLAAMFAVRRKARSGRC